MDSNIIAKVEEIEEISSEVYSLWLHIPDDFNKSVLPGQFIKIYCKDKSRILGRPISICEVDKENKKLRVVFRVVGKGTEEFATLKQGEEVTLMGPLGNGFKVDKKDAVLVAGGLGVAPMVELAKQLNEKKANSIRIVLGYRDKDHIFLTDVLKRYGTVYIATEDGSVGEKGNVMNILPTLDLTNSIVYVCGPKPMMAAVSRFANEKNVEAWVSMEERMACGMGMCLGCAVPVKTETGDTYKRVCADGPVFSSKEVIF